MRISTMFKVLQMFFDKDAVSNFYGLHKKFKENKNYKLRYLVNCSRNVIEHERVLKHEGDYIINSFLPPINSQAFKLIGDRVPGEGAMFYTNHVKGIRLAPISTYIAVTKRCMYKCWHCSASQMMANEQCDLPTDKMLEIIKSLQRLGVGIIGFTGGEPLVREDLEELIRQAATTSMTLVFSNGYGLSLERAKALKAAGLFGIAISFDSTQADEHDAKRGYKGAYKIALEALQYAKSAGIYTMGQVVCTREMLQSGEIHKVAKYLKAQGIHELRIVEPIPCGNLEESMSEVLTYEEKEALIDLHRMYNKDKAYPKTSVFPYIESPEQYGCGAGVQHSYVDYEGHFRACDFIYESYGNILEEPIESIWQRMHEKCGKPKCECFAKRGCLKCESDSIPKYYRLLGGEKK